MKRFLHITGNVITAVLVLMIASTVVLAISARRSRDAIPSILGHKVLTVVSGSMEPAIHTGDVIFVKPLTPADEVQEGDVITFRAKEKSDMLITHRVLGVVQVNGQAAAYVTKGDANDSEDPATVAPDQLIGRYQGRVPYYGYVANFVRTPPGVILLVIIPGVVLIASEVRKLYRILLEAERAKADQASTGPTPPQ